MHFYKSSWFFIALMCWYWVVLLQLDSFGRDYCPACFDTSNPCWNSLRFRQSLRCQCEVFLLTLTWFLWFSFLLLFWVSRAVKRVVATTSSPIYSLMAESLLGVSSVRAFNAQNRLTDKFHAVIDANRWWDGLGWWIINLAVIMRYIRLTLEPAVRPQCITRWGGGWQFDSRHLARPFI